MFRKSSLLTVIALLFLTHGLLYFYAPEDVHNPDSPFKYIKYVLVLAFIIISIKENLPIKILYFLLWVPLFFYYSTINSLGDPINFVGYLLPIYFAFSYRHLSMINWRIVILYSILICSVLGYFEIFFLSNHFFIYNSSKDAYRLVSIFLNPNNLGVSMTLLTFTYVMLFLKNPVTSIIFILNGFLVVFLSVSKTGLIIFVILLLFMAYQLLSANRQRIQVKAKYLVYLAACLPLIGYAAFKFFTGFDFSKIRTISWETLFVRFEGNSYFMSLARDNVLFPWMKNAAGLDNAYLHLWGSFGLPGLVLFILFNSFLLLVIRSRIVFIYLACLLLIGLSTNYLYLWPIGYVYWGLVSIAIKYSVGYSKSEHLATFNIKHINT